MGKPGTFLNGYETAAIEYRWSLRGSDKDTLLLRLRHQEAAWCRGYLTCLFDKQVIERHEARMVMAILNPGWWIHLDIVQSRSKRYGWTYSWATYQTMPSAW